MKHAYGGLSCPVTYYDGNWNPIFPSGEENLCISNTSLTDFGAYKAGLMANGTVQLWRKDQANESIWYRCEEETMHKVGGYEH